MNLEELMASTPPMQQHALIKGFQAGAASRDAEVARLKTVPMRYRRMAFNAQLQDEVARLEQERDQLREQVKMLRKFVQKIKEQTPEKPDYWSSCSQCEHNSSEAEDILEALAATEPKE